ncbi:MAG TPA: hypothetical protein VM938_01030 [Acidimicrobiales bacterium]|nr:hypothetical protein [Acidimicrobiales bacterium]
MPGRRTSVVGLTVIVVAGVIGTAAWMLDKRFGTLPPCRESSPPAGAPDPRDLSAEEKSAVEQIVRADPTIAKIARGQPLAVTAMAEYQAETGMTAGAALVGWRDPVTAPAPLFLGVTDDQPGGRWKNVTNVAVSVDLDRRTISKIRPGPGAESDGVRHEPADCASDH